MYCVSSGASASVEVEHDILREEFAGRSCKEDYITKRLQIGDHFFEPIKRLNLKTMADMNKSVKVRSSTNKTIVYKQQGNVAFQLLVRSQQMQEKLDLRRLLTYPLVPVPYSIGLSDNFLAKTDKSKGLHYIVKNFTAGIIPKHPEECLVIEDGNAIFHYLKEIPDNSRGNFRDDFENCVMQVSRGV